MPTSKRVGGIITFIPTFRTPLLSLRGSLRGRQPLTFADRDYGDDIVNKDLDSWV